MLLLLRRTGLDCDAVVLSTERRESSTRGLTIQRQLTIEPEGNYSSGVLMQEV